MLDNDEFAVVRMKEAALTDITCVLKQLKQYKP